MTWKCPTCGFDGNDDSNILCICGYRNDSTSVAHDNTQQFVKVDIAEKQDDPVTKNNISAMKNRIFFRFMMKALPEVLIAAIPAYLIISNDLLNVLGINDLGIEIGILRGFPSQLFFMGIILIMSLIVSAVRDQEGWINYKGPIHCIIIALAFPIVTEIWIHVSFNLLKRSPGKNLAMEAIVYFLIAVVLIPITLLLGIYVRFVLFSPFILGKQSFRERIVTASFLSFIFAYGLFVLAGG